LNFHFYFYPYSISHPIKFYPHFYFRGFPGNAKGGGHKEAVPNGEPNAGIPKVGTNGDAKGSRQVKWNRGKNKNGNSNGFGIKN